MVVPGRHYVLLLFFNYLFFSTRDLRGPWADLHEILPNVQKHVQFINAGPKILGSAPPPKKKLGWRKAR